MATQKIDPTPAIQAYYDRIEEGTATPEEIWIFPEMLSRFGAAVITAGGSDEKFDGMSEAGKRGEFPMEGLVNAYEVAQFIGKAGLKHPGEALRKMVAAGTFPPPCNPGGKPHRWLVEVVRAHVSNLKPGRKAA